MKQFLKQILRDKNGDFSLREGVIAVLLLVIIISWSAQQFFGRPCRNLCSIPLRLLWPLGALAIHWRKKRKCKARLNLLKLPFLMKEKTIVSTVTLLTSLLAYWYSKQAEKDSVPYVMMGVFLVPSSGKASLKKSPNKNHNNYGS